MKILRAIVTIVVIITCSALRTFGQSNGPETIEELQDSIQKILIKTNTPGAGVAMVLSDSVVLLRGIGKADVERNIDVTENTMFRLGSVSKLFVGLTVLKLQEEGQLNLKDKVKDVLPDLEIINPWESEFPIRIENLLEHTSGLPDWSLAELGCNDPNIKTLKEALDYYPKSRIVRYVPGTRVQYSNVAVSIAAYIVETVSGMKYEDYVAKHFFIPLGAKNMTFQETEQYRKSGAKGYDNGIYLPYFNVLYKPSAALIGSPKDLICLLKFFINRGKVDGIQVLSESSLKRMESNESLQTDKLEEINCFNLANLSSYYNRQIYYGHGGSVFGSQSDFRYLPKYKLGFAIMINDNDQNVLDEISNLIKEFQTKDLPEGDKRWSIDIQHSTQDLSGYYIPVNYKFKGIEFFKKIKSIHKVWHQRDTLFVKSMLGSPYVNKYHPIKNNKFVSEYSDAYELFLTNDPLEGEVISGHMGLLKKISPMHAYLLLTLFFAFIISSFTAFVFALLRLFIYLFSKKKNKTALWICVWPMLNVSIVLVIVLALFTGLQTPLDISNLLGNMSYLSILLFIGTIVFALVSVRNIYFIFKHRKMKMSRMFYYHSVLIAIFHLAFTIYFFSNGIIGITTWL